MDPELTEVVDDYARFTEEVMLRCAEERNCDVEYSHDRVLQLDLDSDEAFYFFEVQLKMLEDTGVLPSTKTTSVTVRRSRSGNRHVTVALDDPLPIETRILLQALLGSDRKREALCYAGLLKGQANPVVLFRPRTTPSSD